MRVTRYAIKKTIKKVEKYISIQKKLAKKSKLYRLAKFICRTDRFTIDGSRNFKDKIDFLYDPAGDHWAETDGEYIWINTHKIFTPNLLYYTILHEYLHGLIIRKDGNYLSERAEHIMMEYLDRRLI